MAGINGKAVALVAGGAVIAYSGFTGKSVSSAIRNTLMGKSPQNAVSANQITSMQLAVGGGPGGVGTLTGPNSAIAARAEQDIGHRYSFGGFYTDPAGWDCSSACNWWLSRFGITLPGGIRNYDGTYHGPVVLNYQGWSGAVPVGRNQVAAGDLVLFGGHHMGIATSNSEFVSAENPTNGTRKDSIDGFGLGTPNFKRIKGVSGSF